MDDFSNSEMSVFPKRFLLLISKLSLNLATIVALQGQVPGPADPYLRYKCERAKPRSKLHPKVTYELFCNLEYIFL